MDFDTRDIRLYMDVYTIDNEFLGEVRKIMAKPGTHEEKQVEESAQQSSKTNGELLGPMPTEPIGNLGPRTQSAEKLYAVQPDDAQRLGQGSITVGKWSGLIGRRTIPLEDIQTVSLEKVVLRLKKDELS